MDKDKRMQPDDSSQGRKDTPVFSGCMNYFPAALALVARLSKVGNDKHNPGEPMHHARGKSSDHADCIARHLSQIGTIDPETGFDHKVMVAWRALALLEESAESDYGWPVAPGAKLSTDSRKPPIPLYHDGVLVGFRADP